MSKSAVFLILLMVNSVFVFSSEREMIEGVIFKQNTSEILYTQKEIVKNMENGRQIEHIYYRKDGTKAASESVILIDDQIVFYETVLDDLGMKGMIRREEDRMIISYNTDDTVKERSIKWKDDLVAGPMLGGFIIENRARLQKGETVEFLLPFFDKQVLIPFKLVSIESENSEEMIIEMKLKNFLLGMLVEPIQFVLDREDGIISKIHGPTILPDPEDNKNKKMLYADIFYSYKGAL